MTEVINPLSSHLEAHDDFVGLRRLIQLTVQSAFLLLVPMAVFLLVFGKDVLSWWAGPSYVSAYPLLVPLTLGMGVAATQCGVQSMLFGISRHKELVVFRLAEGLAITIGGVAILRVFGLPGLAALTSATLLITNLVFIPRHLCRTLNLSMSTYLKETCLKPCLLSLPLFVSLIAVHSVIRIRDWSSLVITLAATISTYGVMLLLLFVNSPSAASWLSFDSLRMLEGRFLPFRKLKPATGLGPEQA